MNAQDVVVPAARVKERLGSLKNEKAVSLIAIHAHDIPNVFRPETLAEAETARAASVPVRSAAAYGAAMSAAAVIR